MVTILLDKLRIGMNNCLIKELCKLMYSFSQNYLLAHDE
jgi:hypothetical protein